MSNLANERSPAIVASPTHLASEFDFMGVSDASNSPQTPQTPQPYGRSRPRYPQELGRVPLHRRGTSKTYERLEDLLKEAGYKETRIFTPEAERSGKCEDDDDDVTVVEDKRTSMVKDVVGFLAGFIPGVSASVAETEGSKGVDPAAKPQTRDVKHSSPLANRATLQPLSHHERQTHVNPGRPQIVVHPTTPHHNQARVHHHQSPPLSHHSPHSHKQHPTQYQKRHGPGLISGSNTHLAPPHTSTSVHSPRPSRATAYLRHMASAPSVVPRRPISTPAGILHSPQSRARLAMSLDEDDSHEILKSQIDSGAVNEQKPPLPTSWLEMVAKAVLFGGAGAHVGGPVVGQQVGHVNERRVSPMRQLRPSRSSLSQVSHKSRAYGHFQHRSKKSPLSAGLSDATNFTPSTGTSSLFLSPGLPSPVPPALFAQLERGRADRCVSEVSRTQVTCRSAPGSRSGSVVRSEGKVMGMEKNRSRNVDGERDVGMEREGRGRNRGVKRRGGAGGKSLKARDKDNLRVPSLARTQVEGDVWSSNMKTRKRSRPESGSLAGISPGTGKNKALYASEGEVDSHSDESEEDEDEEEGELNLARMLLPPKRQNSIRSLQKHLFAPVVDSGGSGTHAKLRHGHHAASGGTKGGGVKSTDGRLRRQTSRARSHLDGNERGEDRVFWHETRHSGAVLPNEGNPKSQNRSTGNEQHKRNSCSDDEDVESFAGFFDVGRKGGVRDLMGSGRSNASGSRLGIGSVWGVIGGGGS